MTKDDGQHDPKDAKDDMRASALERAGFAWQPPEDKPVVAARRRRKHRGEKSNKGEGDAGAGADAGAEAGAGAAARVSAAPKLAVSQSAVHIESAGERMKRQAGVPLQKSVKFDHNGNKAKPSKEDKEKRTSERRQRRKDKGAAREREGSVLMAVAGRATEHGEQAIDVTAGGGWGVMDLAAQQATAARSTKPQPAPRPATGGGRPATAASVRWDDAAAAGDDDEDLKEDGDEGGAGEQPVAGGGPAASGSARWDRVLEGEGEGRAAAAAGGGGRSAATAPLLRRPGTGTAADAAQRAVTPALHLARYKESDDMVAHQRDEGLFQRRPASAITEGGAGSNAGRQQASQRWDRTVEEAADGELWRVAKERAEQAKAKRLADGQQQQQQQAAAPRLTQSVFDKTPAALKAQLARSREPKLPQSVQMGDALVTQAEEEALAAEEEEEGFPYEDEPARVRALLYEHFTEAPFASSTKEGQQLMDVDNVTLPQQLDLLKLALVPGGYRHFGILGYAFWLTHHEKPAEWFLAVFRWACLH